MKKFTTTLVVAVTLVGYVLFQRNRAPSLNPTSATTASTGTALSANYKDGTYTGAVTDAYYGNVEVQATISGGKLINVQFLEYPSDRRESQQINSRAMPRLTEEAVTAQSANVNAVTGATATSGAFVQSLTSALSQAQA